jgi:3-oxoacyl-[acyl-carrier protein] reductase
MGTAIITGASVGIGRAAATQFLELGYRVYSLSRRPCPEQGVQHIPCDLADFRSVEAVGQRLAGELDAAAPIALVHNASQMRKDSAADCDDEDLRQVLETNVVAINALNRALLPVMQSGSSILYIGSTLAEKAVPGSFSYVISKHAQLGMMRATCQDLMGRGIHTALICPGFTDTEMLRTHLGNDPEVLRAIGGMNSFNRLVSPDEIADLIVWSHRHPVINGSVLHANLGQKES